VLEFVGDLHTLRITLQCLVCMSHTKNVTLLYNIAKLSIDVKCVSISE